MKTFDLGVIVARFQVPDLHAGHYHLISTALKQCKNLLFVLGDHGGLPNTQNPIPYPLRRAMLLDLFPQSSVVRLYDEPSNRRWVEMLDVLISNHAKGGSVMLYGSRDSFLSIYDGKYLSTEVLEIPGISGTRIRKQPVAHRYTDSSFRTGVMHAQHLRLPISYQVVDIAILDKSGENILLGQKKIDNNNWRLVGGFVDPTDPSLEAAVYRELCEEVGNIQVSDPCYLGSFRVSDHRYQSGEDKIMSALFYARYQSGNIEANDDLNQVAWHPIKQLLNIIQPGHASLAEAFLNHLSNRK